MCRSPYEVLTLVQEMLSASLRTSHIQRDLNRLAHFSGGDEPLQLKYLQFSDTLLIWLGAESARPLLGDPRQLVTTISYAASWTLACFLSAGIPLRGAVGYGPVHVSSVPLFFTGKELYETMKLEGKQAWAGASLHESAARVLETADALGPFFIEHDVPIEGKSTEIAIDWVTPLAHSPSLIPPWDRMFLATGDTRVARKRDETKRFFDTVFAMRRSFPTYVHEATIAEMRKRLEPLRDEPRQLNRGPR